MWGRDKSFVYIFETIPPPPSPVYIGLNLIRTPHNETLFIRVLPPPPTTHLIITAELEEAEVLVPCKHNVGGTSEGGIWVDPKGDLCPMLSKDYWWLKFWPPWSAPKHKGQIRTKQADSGKPPLAQPYRIRTDTLQY